MEYSLNMIWLCLSLINFFITISFCVEACEDSCRFSYDLTLNEYQNRCDQSATGHISVTDRAHFDGKAFLSLPMFQQNPLRPSFSIAFLFRYTGASSNKDVAILSNGCADGEPSFEFKIQSTNRGRVQLAKTTLSLRMTNDYETMNITSVYEHVNIQREVLVQIAQNETSLAIQVGGQTKQYFNKDVTDYIVRNNCPMQIGAGTGLDNFIGEFDEFIYFPCVNSGFFSIANMFL